MRKRLRKKFRLGEFREFGFEVRFTTPKLTPAEADAFLDQWIEFVESQHLQFGGGGNAADWSGFITIAGRGSTTAGQRDAVIRWLQSYPGVTDVRVSDPIDAWHGPFD